MAEYVSTHSMKGFKIVSDILAAKVSLKAHPNTVFQASFVQYFEIRKSVSVRVIAKLELMSNAFESNVAFSVEYLNVVDPQEHV